MDIHVLDAIAFVLLMFLISYAVWEITQTNFTLRQLRTDGKKIDKMMNDFVENQKIVIDLLKKIIPKQDGTN